MVFLLTSCEEVIDVDLNTAPPQLIVDAPIYWDKTTDGKLQTITISKTSDYFKNEIEKIMVPNTKSKHNDVLRTIKKYLIKNNKK